MSSPVTSPSPPRPGPRAMSRPTTRCGPSRSTWAWHTSQRAAAIGVIAYSATFPWFAAGEALLGAGTAMVYPTLLAAIGDVAHPSWRASAVGVYRLWRDAGYAVGALLAGATADAFGTPAAMWLVAGLTFLSGGVVAVRLRETLQPRPETSAE